MVPRLQAPADLGGVVGRPGVELRRPEGLPHEAAEGAAELGAVVLLAGEGARLPGVADLQLERAVLPRGRLSAPGSRRDTFFVMCK